MSRQVNPWIQRQTKGQANKQTNNKQTNICADDVQIKQTNKQTNEHFRPMLSQAAMCRSNKQTNKPSEQANNKLSVQTRDTTNQANKQTNCAEQSKTNQATRERERERERNAEKHKNRTKAAGPQPQSCKKVHSALEFNDMFVCPL
jgi:hypothetical protein